MIRKDFSFSGKPLPSLQIEEYFMSGGAAEGPVTSPTMVAFWILPRIRNHVKTARNGDFLCLRSKIVNK